MRVEMTEAYRDGSTASKTASVVPVCKCAWTGWYTEIQASIAF